MKHIKQTIERLHEAEVPVSIFIEPDITQIDAAAEINTDIIEIHTGKYANAPTEEEMFEELESICLAAKHAKKLGLGVNAGHGLNYQNIKELILIPDIDEVSIGQAVVARSIFVGVERAVKEMIALIKG